MSWGFFADLNLSIPTANWATIRLQRPRDFELARGWSGLEDEDLEDAFGEPLTTDDTFAKVLAWEWPEGTIVLEEPDGDNTRIRLCVLLDKSQLENAFPLAALLWAARGAGGKGSLRLVNDGTAVAEDGSEIVLADGEIKATKLEDAQQVSEELGDEMIQSLSRNAKQPLINPFTGQPFTSTAKPAK